MKSASASWSERQATSRSSDKNKKVGFPISLNHGDYICAEVRDKLAQRYKIRVFDFVSQVSYYLVFLFN